MTNNLPKISAGSQEILYVAQALMQRSSGSYAKASVPTSPYPNLSGNSSPGNTPLKWLKNLNKCNQFVGDVLTYAGFAMPTWRMHDGSEHYMHAEALPSRSEFFERVDLASAKPGDLVVLDWESKGENGAHVEIISAIDIEKRELITIGAQAKGAKERNSSYILQNLQRLPRLQGWRNVHNSKPFDLFILRPIQKLKQSAQRVYQAHNKSKKLAS